MSKTIKFRPIPTYYTYLLKMVTTVPLAVHASTLIQMWKFSTEISSSSLRTYCFLKINYIIFQDNQISSDTHIFYIFVENGNNCPPWSPCQYSHSSVKILSRNCLLFSKNLMFLKNKLHYCPRQSNFVRYPHIIIICWKW